MSDPTDASQENGVPGLSAVMFGSIGTIADTSELQRQAFNDAFGEHGLDWNWDRGDYLEMLEESGGQDRVARYASSVGQDVDSEAIHASKSKLFQQSLAESSLSPREGVADAVTEAKDQGIKVALVTTTSGANISSLADALRPALDIDGFDLVVDSSSVAEPKPDAAAYNFALQSLGESAEDCVAIEDNLGGVDSAAAAGIRCVAFPNENTAGHEFDRADRRVDEVSLADLEQVVATR